MRKQVRFLLIICALFVLEIQPANVAAQNGGEKIYIPLAYNRYNPLADQQIANAPYIQVNDVIQDKMNEMGIFWFGKVRSDTNYTDVRVAYNDEALWVHTAIFDRRIWYNPSANADSLENWDSVTLLLHLDGMNQVLHPTSQSYKFVAQMRWWEQTGSNFMATYQGNGSQWVSRATPLTVNPVWRGDAPNNNIDDRGWTMTFKIPFSSLGLAGKPADGTVWRMALQVHDRDFQDGPALPDQLWPDLNDAGVPLSWGRLRFGLPDYSSPSVTNVQTTTIRNGLNGAVVPDASVGGSSVCGSGMDFWTQWGERSYPGQDFFNIQNQSDVSEWPCFSKYYVAFPLGAIPPGKTIRSAKLVLYQFGGSNPTDAWPSLIQVFQVKQDWNEATLNWNNAPQAIENIAQTWVDVIKSGWQEVPYEWDVSHAAELAYQQGVPLRLAVYSADSPMHSGKYFRSSDSNDWNGSVRPKLVIEWGDPQ